MYRRLVELGISQRFFYRLHRTAKQVRIHFFEPSARNSGVEIDPFEKRVNFNASLTGATQCSFRTFASGAQPAQGAGIRLEILFVLSFEFSNEMIYHSIIEVFTT
mmetsp:Transcript_27673/g.33799  ORF Transcript_27673/g.33799 Transcript_27673/m.33799 type:complete len:105 (+) Transcript_27673:191-505(+)